MSDKDAVGTLIEGRVSGNVMHKGKVAVPGRRDRARPDSTPGAISGQRCAASAQVGELESQGEPARCTDLVRLDKDPRIEVALTLAVRPHRGSLDLAQEEITLPELPGVASFFVKGYLHADQGFRML